MYSHDQKQSSCSLSYARYIRDKGIVSMVNLRFPDTFRSINDDWLDDILWCMLIFHFMKFRIPYVSSSFYILKESFHRICIFMCVSMNVHKCVCMYERLQVHVYVCMNVY